MVNILSLGLSASRALLGNVSANLRAVTVDCTDEFYQVSFFYDGEISEEEHEFLEHTMDQIIGDFWTNKEPKFKYFINRLDYPKAIPEQGVFVYQRYEK